jgi:hypothetical protein
MPRRELRNPEVSVGIFADEVMATFTIPYSRFGPVDVLLTEDEAFRLATALSERAAALRATETLAGLDHEAVRLNRKFYVDDASTTDQGEADGA